MELIKQNWTCLDGKEFSKFLLSLSKGEAAAKREKNILNTSLPCIAVSSENVNDVAKQIYNGNYLSFLNLNLKNNYSEVAVSGKIICKITDFEILKKHLNNYLSTAECWATTDILKFKIKNNEDNFLSLIKTYCKSPKTFVRRAAVIIAFNFINLPKYDDEILNVIKTLKNDTEYYVNMAVAWIVCEYFIKRRDLALKILTQNFLNDFTQNKAISKCNDSFRISSEDKKLLANYKRK